MSVLGCIPANRPVDHAKANRSKIELSGFHSSAYNATNYGIDRIEEIKQLIDLVLNPNYFVPSKEKNAADPEQPTNQNIHYCERKKGLIVVDKIFDRDDSAKYVITRMKCNQTKNSDSVTSKIDGVENLEVFYLQEKGPVASSKKIVRLVYSANNLLIDLGAKAKKTSGLTSSSFGQILENRELVADLRSQNEIGDANLDKFYFTFKMDATFQQRLKDKTFDAHENKGTQKIEIAGNAYVDGKVKYMSDLKLSLFQMSPRDVFLGDKRTSPLFTNDNNGFVMNLLAPVEMSFDPKCGHIEGDFLLSYMNLNEDRNRFNEGSDEVSQMQLSVEGRKLLDAKSVELKSESVASCNDKSPLYFHINYGELFLK